MAGRPTDADKKSSEWYRLRNLTHTLVTHNKQSREHVMREALERILGQPFWKARPGWLRNEATGRRLELDAWNEELRVACEFNGVQHERYPNPFHATRAQFDAQQARDRLKVALCQQHSVFLIIVPSCIRKDDIEGYLREQLRARAKDVQAVVVHAAAPVTEHSSSSTDDLSELQCAIASLTVS